MIISQTPEEIHAATAIQSNCELSRIALASCQASADGVPENLQPPFKLQIAHSSSAFPIVGGSLRIKVNFNVNGVDASSPPATLFTIVCTFDVDYQIKDASFEPTPESITAFKDGNAVFNCWPYSREFIQSIVSRMAITPPPLPLLRFVPQTRPTPEPETGTENFVPAEANEEK